MLITDTHKWDLEQFEAYVEGMCHQMKSFPHERVAFWAPTTPEVILTLFACWKIGKIACPLNTRLPSCDIALQELGTELFTPQMPTPMSPTPYQWDLNLLATFLFTSGSTGRPKIACHTLGNHVFSALGSNQLIPLQPSDSWALTLPLFHVGGLGILFRSYLAKSSILLSRNWQQATHLSLVPTQLHRLLRDSPDLPHLRTILLGGAPIPDLQTPWTVLPTYGMTEMSSQIITDHQLHPYAELRLSSDQEIYVRGAVLFQGYFEKERGITLPLQEGWFATRDLGGWDGNRFQIIGRKDNLFISGGENIQPEEVEELIRRTCGIEEVLIVPLNDPVFGARPVVFLRDPSLLEQVQQALLRCLPKYKIPIRAFPWPKEIGLKPNRKALAASINL